MAIRTTTKDVQDTNKYRNLNTTAGRTHSAAVSDQNFTTYNYGPLLRSSHNEKQYDFTQAVPDMKTHSTFFPDADLMRRDGEVSLSFLSGNGIYFTSPTDDDWYRANRRYRPQEAASPLGCIQQWQFCRDPARGQCGNLANRFDALYSAAPWFDLTSDDMESSRPIPKTRSGSLLLWLFFTLMETVTSLHGIITTLGPTSLASQAFLQSGTMMRIQQNQWHLDVERWWQMIMAGFQASFISTARGSGFILGLALTYSISVLIVVLSFIAVPVLGLLQKYGRYS
ncbi:hypothetical protein PG996_013512 [Apiospora saccharicola]|uniref:Uncharacterized protein n=1 Tax=Apiospora saccharicola TaxID=335842 RepID=A0ABR1U5N8_9PEZI